jgi:hypothetical protein
VDAKTNEHKAALQLLGVLPVRGNVFTGDAMFCQRDVAQKIVEGGGDHVLFVKDNQPTLKVDIAAGLAFEPQKRRQAAAFFPLPRPGAAGGRRGERHGQGARARGEADDPADGGPDQTPGLGGARAGLRADASQARG